MHRVHLDNAISARRLAERLLVLALLVLVGFVAWNVSDGTEIGVAVWIGTIVAGPIAAVAGLCMLYACDELQRHRAQRTRVCVCVCRSCRRR